MASTPLFSCIVFLSALLTAPLTAHAADNSPQQGTMGSCATSVSSATTNADMENQVEASRKLYEDSKAQFKSIQEFQKKMAEVPTLPPGPYSQKCMTCKVMKDDHANTLMSCVCPMDSGVTLARINLDTCKKDENISYCYGILTCGPCPVQKMIPAKPVTSSGNKADDLVNTLFPKK